MMGKRLKEIFGLILINITLVSGSLNAETVYADTQAKIEIEKTEMPLKICVDEENKKTVLQIVAAWKKIYKNNGVELMVIPSGQQASEEKVQEIQNEITTGEGPDVFFAEGPNPTWSEQRVVVFGMKTASTSIFAFPIPETDSQKKHWMRSNMTRRSSITAVTMSEFPISNAVWH